VTHPVLCNR